MTADDRIDLHVHSLRSDGLLSLLQLCNLARRSGLAAFALTDHDALPDAAALADAVAATGVEVLPGVEISTSLGERGLHILGYGFELADSSLHELCRRAQAGRRERFAGYVAALEQRGLRLDRERLGQHSVSPGRTHLARELVRQGKAGSIKAAVQRFLAFEALPASDWTIDVADGIEALHAAGGVAVLAHPPADLTRDVWHSLVDFGLDGVEARYPGASARHRRFLADRCAEHRLAATAGADFHGDDPRHYLGRETVDGPALVALLRRRQSSRYVEPSNSGSTGGAVSANLTPMV